MKTYFEAYQERLERNQTELIQLIKEVIEKDNTIEAYVHKDQSRFIDGVVFSKGELINSIHFHEVPYRWSGCGYKEHTNSHSGGDNSSMPFTSNDVLTSFKPVTSVLKTHDKPFKNKADYFGWCSYLHNVCNDTRFANTLNA